MLKFNIRFSHKSNFLLFALILLTSTVYSQKFILKGKVTDQSNLPLPGVSIVIQGTSQGTETDLDGNYTIKVKTSDVLIFSYIGMKTIEKTVGGVTSSNIINVIMQSDNILEEIVLTGYTKQSTKNITGSVSVVKMKDVEATAPISVEQSLQGQVSGVSIGTQGGPGGSTMVRIRGFATVNNNDPLYVIDGIPTKSGLNLLNPNNIESIQVLKDASSAAIYGVGANNGVIIITTKSGKYKDITKLTFNANIAVDYISKNDFPKLLNPQETANAIWQRFKNDGVAPSHPQYGSGDEPVLPNFLTPAGASTADLSTYDPLTNKITRANKQGTNWFDEYFNPALVENYNLNLSGGSEKSKFHAGIGLLRQQGVSLHSYFDRYNLNLNSEFKVKKGLRIGETLNLSYSEKVNNQFNEGDTFFSLTEGDIAFLYRAQPIIPVYDIAGNFAGTQSTGLGNGFNSIATSTRNKNNINRTLRALTTLYGEVDIFKDLIFKSNIGLDYNVFHRSAFIFLNPEVSEPNTVNSFRESTFYTIASNWYNTLNYNKKFGNHKIEVLAGTEFRKTSSRGFNALRTDFFTNDIDFRYLSVGTGTQTNSGNGDKATLFSIFGKLDYNYDNRYLASVTFRRDGSSSFSKINRYGSFPSYSFAWRLSEHDFIKKISFINDLKLKIGYGEYGNPEIPTGRISNLYGNDETTGNYDITGSNNSVVAGYFLQALGNKDLRWETSTSLNFGIDASLFGNRLDFNLELYQSLTKDMLLQLPSNTTINGFASPSYGNIGEMENRGFDFLINYSQTIANDLKLTASANISAYKNKVVKLNDSPDFFILGDEARATRPSRTQQGQPLASFHGFVIDGIIQNEQDRDQTANYNGKDIGTFKYRDLNNDNIINDKDRTFIGSPHPDFTYGLNLNLEYQNFDFSILFQGSQGNDIYNFTKFFTDYNSFPGAKSNNYLYGSWTPDNPNAVLPKLSNSPAQHYSSESSYYVEDGSYLRLKNIRFAYNFSKQLTDKLRMGDFKIYLQAKNLFTWTKYSGLDPEVNLQNYQGSGINLDIGIDRGVYPVSKTVQLGINFQL
ncbi:MAG: SusC/RagA family TonB-linked outer membrane protein [Tenacibaculum sp.]